MFLTFYTSESYTFKMILIFVLFVSCADIGGQVYGPTTAADLSTLFDVGGIIGTTWLLLLFTFRVLCAYTDKRIMKF